MLAGVLGAVLVSTLIPTVVSAPRLRQRRPSAIESLTEPPLESSTIVAPPSCRPRAHSENAALDIVAKLAKSDTANRNTSITSVIPRLSGGTSRVVTAYIQRRQLVLPGRRCGFGTKS